MQLFTSLYSMMPTSNKYFVKAGSSATAAAFMMIGLFVAGVIAIRLLSGVIHSHIPSKVVECDPDPQLNPDVEHGRDTEETPLLQRSGLETHHARPDEPSHDQPKEPVISRLYQRVRSIFPQAKPCGDGTGQCLGFSQPCEHGCVRCGKRPSIARSSNGRVGEPSEHHDAEPHGHGHSHEGEGEPLLAASQDPTGDSNIAKPLPRLQTASTDPLDPSSSTTTIASSPIAPQALLKQHHHHVPRQQFLSLGLQTSLAIALHKLPEGFITFATNHASPKLGWSVFLALFIHNLTEGFAMCLPLYLALGSRLKAIIWSSVLGGISQPAGAGIAALWIWGAQKGAPHLGDGTIGSDKVSFAVYGGMFAATAGVMTNVGLQLFAESLQISGRPTMCIGFAIAGMGILGVSFALTPQ